ELIVREYDASKGKEFFISYETKNSDKMLGFVRLRLPRSTFKPYVDRGTALIRELHVYGSAVAIGKKEEHTQHKGIGKRLMAVAEEIAKKNNKNKIVVISGVGVRNYYRKLGYRLNGPYMVKKHKK
ncbi:MAG: GNAT family N-acetyltransferase, partial [Nanoarchaeota archaeon]